MRRGLHTQAFTIIETLIVLAVSGLLLLSAFVLISNQQQKTQFGVAIRDIQSQVDEVINNVASGYYASNLSFNCTATPGGPVVTAGSGTRGTNGACIVLGRTMQFGVHGTSGEGFNVYNLVGLHYISSGSSSLPSTLAQAKPIALSYSSSSGAVSFAADTTDKRTLQYSLNARTMRYDGPNDTGAVAFISGLGQPDSSGSGLVSGAQPVSLYAVANSALDNTQDAIVTTIDNPSNLKPASKVEICFDSAGTNQYGLITIGSNNRQLSTTLKISSGSCS